MWKIPRGTRSERRNLAQEFIHSAIVRGMKNTEIVNALRDNELSYHTQTMFQDINGWRSALGQWDEVEGLAAGETIPGDWYIESNRRLNANYETQVRIRVRNTDTAEVYDKFMTIMHTHETPFGESMDLEQILTPDEIKQRAIEKLSTYGSPLEVIDIDLVAGYRRPDIFGE